VNRARPGLWGAWLGNRWAYPEAEVRYPSASTTPNISGAAD